MTWIPSAVHVSDTVPIAQLHESGYASSSEPLTVCSPLPDVRQHRLVAVLRPEVTLRREKELDVLLGRGEGRGGFIGGHGGVCLYRYVVVRWEGVGLAYLIESP